MPKRIVVIGAGGFGRGVLGWLRGSPEHLARKDVEEIVVVDDSPAMIDSNLPWISSFRDYKPQRDDEVICAVGQPEARRRIVSKMTKVGARFHTFAHDTAVIGDRVLLSAGCIVCPGAVISADARLGPHCHVNFNSSLGHDVELGAFATLSPSANIMGEVVVGRETFVGGSAVVLPRLSIGSRVVIGAGSVVLNDVCDDSTVVGNPARVLSR